MDIHDIHLWHVYLCPRCNASDPPKDKYVVIVCKRKDSVWGFFINSNIPRFILASPELASSQIEIDPTECSNILKRNSFIGCNDLKDFYTWEITKHFCALKGQTIEAILTAVETSTTIDPEKIQLIKASRPKT